MSKRLKILTAGRLVSAVCYTVAGPRDTLQERRSKQTMSTAAQDSVNLRRSWQKLEMSLAANFGRRDLHVVLTYDDVHLPTARDAAVDKLRRMLRQLRTARKLTGTPTRYVYVTEQLSAEGGRLHHHLVLNGTGHDVEALRSLWPWGQVEVERLDTWQGYEALARYLTKEPREVGKCRVGERTWTPSLRLKKPTVETALVRDGLTIALPPGAVVLSRRGDNNGWGEYTYLKYLLPDRQAEGEKKGTRPPPKRKTKQPARLYSVWKQGVTSGEAQKKGDETIETRTDV